MEHGLSIILMAVVHLILLLYFIIKLNQFSCLVQKAQISQLLMYSIKTFCEIPDVPLHWCLDWVLVPLHNYLHTITV